ncbi:MAG: pyruvate kinase [Deltaproteobacteria bacterium]|nr:pyruvate kinase [Deltaproteobacteria bacterium]
MRRTKIVATIGPASNSPKIIDELLMAGVNVCRLNFSHGTLDEHKAVIADIRAAAMRLDLPVSILLDLQGPKIRTGLLEKGIVELREGRKITITTEGIKGNEDIISTTYMELPRDVKAGDRILMDDGLIEVRVIGVAGNNVECEVVYGGILKEHKGMNLPGVNVSAPSLSRKDLRDLDFGISQGVDYIALSFVRRASDVIALKEYLREKGVDIPVIAKIEKPEALDNLDAIIEESDGIMVARGDLGVELSAEEVPIAQKRIISMANEAGKPVITATQMLESMINNPRPTRAEASDVANAVFDGTDALMLSGETAVGKYPVKTVEIMAKIAVEAEEAALSRKQFMKRRKEKVGSFSQAVAFASYAAAGELHAKAIVVFSQTGGTAKLVSKLRSPTPIITFTPLEETKRRLSLVWGIQPFCIEFGGHTDEMICRGEAAMLNNGLAELGDTIIVVSGTKVGMRGATNMMKIDRIGSEECKLFLKGDTV